MPRNRACLRGPPDDHDDRWATFLRYSVLQIFAAQYWTLIKCISFGTINVTPYCVNFVTVLIIGLTTGQQLPRKPRATSTLNRHSDVMPRTRNT